MIGAPLFYPATEEEACRFCDYETACRFSSAWSSVSLIFGRAFLLALALSVTQNRIFYLKIFFPWHFYHMI